MTKCFFFLFSRALVIFLVFIISFVARLLLGVAKYPPWGGVSFLLWSRLLCTVCLKCLLPTFSFICVSLYTKQRPCRKAVCVPCKIIFVREVFIWQNPPFFLFCLFWRSFVVSNRFSVYFKSGEWNSLSLQHKRPDKRCNLQQRKYTKTKNKTKNSTVISPPPSREPFPQLFQSFDLLTD